MSAFKGKKRQCQPQVSFTDSEGRIWCYRGKRARVLIMLIESGSITQWDTLPWHTRLGGTIHAMRRDGLEIETEIEGDDRHARYRLRTKGTLKLHQENSGSGLTRAA